ncbi:MAG: CPBP family intramembrane metalloprotease [Clostridia bacterium]|nr:CPBP family intramembrane metalloprotease [Clostridia bacterium]
MLEENNNFEINQNENQATIQETTMAYENPYSFIPEEYRKKKDIRRLALIVGIPALSLSVIGYLWSFVYLFFTVKIAGMSYNEAVELSQNPAVQQILQIIISCFMFLVPFTIAAKCVGIRIDNTIQFGRARKGTALPFLLFGIGFCSFANLAMSYSSALFEGFGINYDVPDSANPSGIFGFLLTFISTAIVPALVEEFACRGIVLGLLKKYGEGFAIITSSILFGIMHGNFEQIPFAVMVGLILGYIYVKTNSIWICVAVHGANNAVSVIFSYLENIMTVNMQNLLYIVYLIISMLSAIFGVLLLAKKQKESYDLEKQEDIIKSKQKYTWFFTSWVIILFIIFNILESMTYFLI